MEACAHAWIHPEKIVLYAKFKSINVIFFNCTRGQILASLMEAEAFFCLVASTTKFRKESQVALL